MTTEKFWSGDTSGGSMNPNIHARLAVRCTGTVSAGNFRYNVGKSEKKDNDHPKRLGDDRFLRKFMTAFLVRIREWVSGVSL
jgi:hypothetical protein